MRQFSLLFSSIETKNHKIDSNICEIESVFLLLTALIRNFYKFLMGRIDAKAFGLKKTSRIKAFVFKFISVPAKWIRTVRHYQLNIYSCNNAYADVFQNDFG